MWCEKSIIGICVKSICLTLLCSLLFVCSKVDAQDIHFSSLSFSPMFNNPAYTGLMNYKFRVSSIYRNQWSTVSKGYNTFLASAECQPMFSNRSLSGMGLGLSFTNDVAGSLSYGEQDIGFALSYFFALNRKKDSFLSIGVLGKRESWGYNSVNANFNQSGIYDDNIKYENLTTYTLSLGAAYQFDRNERSFQLGVAVFNINEPSLTYFENSTDESKVHRRYNLNTAYYFNINEKLALRPQILINQQYKYNEFVAGTDLVIHLDDAIFTQQLLSIGLFCRNGESIIVSPKYKYNSFLVGVSYDVNISQLAKVSNTYGAMEIWLSYAFDPSFRGKHKNTKIPCPIF